MDGNLHHTIPDSSHHQEEDQVVPDIDISQTDDLSVLGKHVLMCNKVVEFLKQEILSAQLFPNPFYINNHRVHRGDSFNSLQISLEIKNQPLDKFTLEYLGIILRYNYLRLGIDVRSIQQAGSDESKLRFKFTGLIMPIELKLASSSLTLSYLSN